VIGRDVVTLRRSARKGTVCNHCWWNWKNGPDHKASECGDVWPDRDSPNGWTVCMCGCRRATP
jgi:hypothetical protein